MGTMRRLALPELPLSRPRASTLESPREPRANRCSPAFSRETTSTRSGTPPDSSDQSAEAGALPGDPQAAEPTPSVEGELRQYVRHLIRQIEERHCPSVAALRELPAVPWTPAARPTKLSATAIDCPPLPVKGRCHRQLAHLQSRRRTFGGLTFWEAREGRGAGTSCEAGCDGCRPRGTPRGTSPGAAGAALGDALPPVRAEMLDSLASAVPQPARSRSKETIGSETSGLSRTVCRLSFGEGSSAGSEASAAAPRPSAGGGSVLSRYRRFVHV